MTNIKYLHVNSKIQLKDNIDSTCKNTIFAALRTIIMFCSGLLFYINGAFANETLKPKQIQQIEQAAFWYGQAKKISKDQIHPDVLRFMVDFTAFLESQSQLDPEQKSTEDRLEALLRQYDGLIQKSGPTAEQRSLELQALSAVFSDLPKAIVFLEKFHKVIESHYTQKLIDEKNRYRPRVSVFELMKTIGRYSIYGLSVSGAFHYVTGEYKTIDIFSEPVYQRAIIVAIASGPFGFFDQLFSQTMDYLKTVSQIRYGQIKTKISTKIKVLQCRFITK